MNKLNKAQLNLIDLLTSPDESIRTMGWTIFNGNKQDLFCTKIQKILCLLKSADEYGIKKCWVEIIDEKFFVNCNEDVDFQGRDLKVLPFHFGVVFGNFDCSWNDLENLIGCPHTIHGHFNCSLNRLRNLNGCPKIVRKGFNCGSPFLNLDSGGVAFGREEIRNICEVGGSIFNYFLAGG